MGTEMENNKRRKGWLKGKPVGLPVDVYYILAIILRRSVKMNRKGKISWAVGGGGQWRGPIGEFVVKRHHPRPSASPEVVTTMNWGGGAVLGEHFC